jgi:hypothetical protein
LASTRNEPWFSGRPPIRILALHRGAGQEAWTGCKAGFSVTFILWAVSSASALIPWRPSGTLPKDLRIAAHRPDRDGRLPPPPAHWCISRLPPWQPPSQGQHLRVSRRRYRQLAGTTPRCILQGIERQLALPAAPICSPWETAKAAGQEVAGQNHCRNAHPMSLVGHRSG